MRIRHIWEGTNRGVLIRVEQSRAFPFRARTRLLVRGELVASADTNALATMKVRLGGEYVDADGRVEVLVKVRGDEGFNAENLRTVTCDDSEGGDACRADALVQCAVGLAEALDVARISRRGLLPRSA